MITQKIIAECLHCKKDVEIVAVACSECSTQASDLKQVAHGLSSSDSIHNRPHTFEPYGDQDLCVQRMDCRICDRDIDDSIHTEPAGIFPAAGQLEKEEQPEK